MNQLAPLNKIIRVVTLFYEQNLQNVLVYSNLRVQYEKIKDIIYMTMASTTDLM